jgi:multimeric flavodoxin WrbA
MNILLINGSPKKKGGASAFLSKVLRFMLFPQKIVSKTIGVSRNYEDIFTNLKNMDIVVISVPLYVDSMPSHMIYFLHQMEQYCANNKCKFMLYVISNSGFVGGHQNKAHLEQYKCWCERAGITWGGGLGIGGGVMLHVIFYVILLLSIIQFVIGILINVFSGKLAVNNALLLSFARSMIIWLFFSSGMIFCEFILARAIKKQKVIKNKYTRAMVPSFIFLIFADIFMALGALFHGKAIFSLYRKIDYKKLCNKSSANIHAGG